MKLTFCTAFLSCLLVLTSMKAQESFSSFQELADQYLPQSYLHQNNQLLQRQAEKEKEWAIYELLAPSGGIFSSYTNNTRLPVSLIPSEILGGSAGTFEQVRFGQKYVTEVNAYAEIQLLNLSGWENLNYANTLLEQTKSNNKLSIKSRRENLATVYYNILELQEQLKALQKNKTAADTLYRITQNKYDEGLVNAQSLRKSQLNTLQIELSIGEVENAIQQWYLLLKTRCDLAPSANIQINQIVDTSALLTAVPIRENTLSQSNALLNVQAAESALRSSKLAFAPTLSFFANYLLQGNNNQANIFSDQATWINSDAIGLKLSIPIPSASTIKQKVRAEYDYQIAKNQASQATLQARQQTQQLQLDLDQAQLQYEYHQKQYQLFTSIYEKQLLNYRAGLLGLADTIDSFNEMTDSHRQLVAAAVSILKAQTNIEINNTIN
ncbi:MAG: TolC family protein [Bacteroidota bacterium]